MGKTKFKIEDDDLAIVMGKDGTLKTFFIPDNDNDVPEQFMKILGEVYDMPIAYETVH
tara:strand:- start:1105 stop:1278 length:174 start_codon:yes stop_codon:yes gene_type:complete